MPLSLPEILETVRMTEADAFDIRTVTLGISLRGCASRDPESTRQNIYDRITQTARHHVEVGAFPWGVGWGSRWRVQPGAPGSMVDRRTFVFLV